MASRSSRSGARASPAPGSRPRAPSPLSPTKISRTEEKRTLGHLNDRLAAYISKVKTLETENSSLKSELTTIEESQTKEVTRIQGMYDKELAQVMKANLFLIFFLDNELSLISLLFNYHSTLYLLV